jgi:Tol biopolymer transport system component
VDALARGLLAGIAAAHAHGLVHRDLKPGNVLLDVVDGAVVPKIADFGLAKVVASAPDATATRSGMAMGTPPYMAPEQIRDASRTDARADVFSAGAILYELVAGRRAFDGADTWEVFSAVQEGRYAPLPDGTPPAWIAAIAGALAVDRDARIPTAAALLAAWGLPLGPAWTAADLADIAELAPVGESAVEAGLGTWAGSSGPEVEVPSNATFLEAPPSEVAPERRPARWPWAVSLGILAIGLAIAAFHLRPTATLSEPALRRLTWDGAPKSWVALSPDGGTLAYGMGDDLWLRKVDGDRAVSLTADFDPPAVTPSFSPDGSKIAFSVERTHPAHGVYVMSASGDSPHRVADRGFRPAWSPDGSKLAFVTCDAWEDVAWLSDSGTVEVVDLASGVVTPIVAKKAYDDVAWSPDGRWLALLDDERDLWTIPASGGTPTRIWSETPRAWGPLWSADSSALRFLSDRSGAPNVWSLPIDSATGLASGPATPVTRAISGPVWCLAGAGRRLLLDRHDVVSTLWVSSLGEDGVLPAPTPALHLAQTIGAVAPSPDGKTVAFDTYGAVEDVFAVDIATRRLRQLTDTPARDQLPAWRPDGSGILFRSSRDGARKAFEMSPEGGDVRPVPALGDIPMWMVPSPDGRSWLIATADDGVLQVDGTTGSETGPSVHTPMFIPLDWTARGILGARFDEGIRWYGADWTPGDRLPCVMAGAALADGTVVCRRAGHDLALDRVSSDGVAQPWFTATDGGQIGIPLGLRASPDHRTLAFVTARVASDPWLVDLGTAP